MNYFTCSVGKPDTDYIEENLKRIINRSGFVLHEDTKQKGTFDDIQPDDVLLLRYNEMFIAYGQVTKCVKTEDEDWNLWAFVKKWYFFDKSNPRIGISRKGVDENTLGGGKYGTVKTIKQEFALKKLREIDSNSELYATIININNHAINNKMILEKLALLKYKKQIILQGPPGTGKTREAKILADVLIRENLYTINFLDYFEVNDKIANYSGVKNYYTIMDVNKDTITLKNEEAKEERSVTLNDVIENFEKATDTLTNQEYNSDFKFRYIGAVVKFLKTKGDFDFSNQCKVIQFHPSYTYEDFVRGIVAESKGDKIEYRNVNKILGEFAEMANSNYKASIGNTTESNIDVWINDAFEDFKNNIQAKLPEEETLLTGDISIFEVSEDHFKYAKKWQSPGYLKFSEFKKLVKAILQKEIDLASGTSKLDKNKFLHSYYRYTYYSALLNKFFNEYNYETNIEKIEQKNYVLVIDEINRANLSSVLGELIYALEYRGEEVESMYAVGEDKKLILPPNLYIIGTMNTADRSVGHIDYAIRRRFAFVDVLPKDLTGEPKVNFDGTLFNTVKELFTTDEYITRSAHLSNEFEPKDVALGHSYFLQKKEKDVNGKDILVPSDFNIRLEYEIKPILLEYVKDGVLIGENIIKKIKELQTSI